MERFHQGDGLKPGSLDMALWGNLEPGLHALLCPPQTFCPLSPAAACSGSRGKDQVSRIETARMAGIPTVGQIGIPVDERCGIHPDVKGRLLFICELLEHRAVRLGYRAVCAAEWQASVDTPALRLSPPASVIPISPAAMGVVLV
ncbi:MAG: hypothetical protein OXC91_00125 [Rhodobacteraceae bacterium]|nr:hypothetical protein [Paracoccaceae bacterium]